TNGDAALTTETLDVELRATFVDDPVNDPDGSIATWAYSKTEVARQLPDSYIEPNMPSLASPPNPPDTAPAASVSYMQRSAIGNGQRLRTIAIRPGQFVEVTADPSVDITAPIAMGALGQSDKVSAAGGPGAQIDPDKDQWLFA